MFFKLCRTEQNECTAEFLHALILTNIWEQKHFKFDFKNILATGLHTSVAGFLFVEIVLTPISPIKINFILPHNLFLIACIENILSTKSKKIKEYGFVQKLNKHQITIDKPLCIKLLCCKYPYGDDLFAPKIDLFNFALIRNTFCEVVNCKHLGISKSLFLIAKFYEVLSIAGYQACACEPDATNERLPVLDYGQEFALRSEDLRKINNAKSIIANTLQNPCSLIELAHKVGLNDFKLKKCFKEVYGTTVFGYLHDIRMDKACILLKQKEKISEVAYAIGYKNAQHFTAAFKKKFGVVPSEFWKLVTS